MKAHIHITTIFTVLFIGFSTLNGQASARTGEREKQERPTVKRTEAKKMQARQTQSRQTQAKHTQTRQSTVKQNKGHDQRYTTRYNETAVRPVMAHNKPAKINAPHTAKPNKGSSYGRLPVKENKYSKKHYYGGNHYHNAYPVHKVKTHYHYNTHKHSYNVLYYPSYREIYWNHHMYVNYNKWYPNYHWNYKHGYRIQTISIFDAKYNMGEVANVYGRVYSTWYNRETDDYLLFFGGDFGAQQFTLVLPGRIARKFNRKPTRYFLGEHLTVTGLITTFDGIPEIVVKNRKQLRIY